MRGVLQHPLRQQQIIDFNGMVYGSITPTDIDGVIEYKNKAYVFFEVKYDGKELPLGQKIAIERLVNDTSANGKESIALVLTHSVDNAEQPVTVTECIVREVYHSKEKKWREPKHKITAKQAVDEFISHIIGGGRVY